MTLIHSMLPIARRRLVTTQDDAPVIEVAKLLADKHTSLVVVCNDTGHMSGVITKADVVRQISHCTGCSCTEMAATIMAREIICCHPDDKVDDVWSIMRKNTLRQIPISSSEGWPLGLLYASDILQVLLKEVKHEELLLRDYVLGIGYQ